MSLVKSISKFLTESEQPAVDPARLFVVFAAAGRHNGWAVVNAGSKKEAKQIARDSDWLDMGRVTGVTTVVEYAESVAQDLDEHIEDLLGDHPELATPGNWAEIDWGT